MSSIGKVLLLVNLVLAAAFVGWALSLMNHVTDYKKEIADLKAANETALADKDGQIKTVQDGLDAMTAQEAKARESRDDVQAEADRYKSQLDELKRTSDALQANITKIQTTLGDYNNSIAQLTQQKDAAIERAHEAERARDSAVQEKDAAVVAQNDAEEASKTAQTRIGDLEGEKSSLSEQISALETRLAMVVERTGINVTDYAAQPKIDGAVLQVHRDLKLVVINKGRKDNVKEGFTFDIYKGSQYKGQVRIQNVQETMSSGLILTEKSSIATGDSATTAL